MMLSALALWVHLAGAGISELDTSLVAFSERLHEAYLRQGRVIDEPPDIFTTASTQVQKLNPDTPLEFFMLADPSPNALSLANGHVYLNLGLLADMRRLEDLLFVLAHEASHVVRGHVALRLRQPRDGLAEATEVEADRDALAVLGKAGWNTTGVDQLLGRLDRGEPGGRGDRRRQGLQQSSLYGDGAAFSAPGGGAAALGLARREAVNLLMAHGRLDPVKRLLADVGIATPWQRAWAAELARRTGQPEQAVMMAETAAADGFHPARRTLALALQQQGRLDQALEAWRAVLVNEPDSVDSPVLAALLEQGCQAADALQAAEQAGVRFAGLTVPRGGGFRVALQTGEKLILTNNAVRLTRVDLHRPVAAEPSCLLDVPGLQQSLVQLRQDYHPEKLVLDRVYPLPGRGMVADLHYTDRDALRWRVRQYLLVGRDHHVRLVLTAPALNYFDAAAEAVARIAMGVGG